MSISAVLKKHGYQSDVLISASKKEISDHLSAGCYPLVGFTTMIGEEKLVFELAHTIKQQFPEIKIVLGGMYPTLNPEKAISHEAVDFIVRGEGEYPVLELIEAMSNTRDVTGILNVWGKDNGRVWSNPLRDLNNLDDLPGFDYALYDRYDFIKNDPTKNYIISRGCPYSCSFCYNKILRNTYKGCGTYYRLKSSGKVMEELKQIKQETVLKTLFLLDDSFLTDRSFLREFAQVFPSLNLSLVALARADQIDEEIASLLKKCRTRCILIAVESGDEEYRNTYLNKKISNEQIVNAVTLLKKNGMMVISLNMMALPNETIDMALSTVDLNIQAGVKFASTGFYCPYPGVELSDYAADIYHLSRDFFENLPSDYTTRPLLPVDNERAMINIQRLTLFMVRFPVFRPLLETLIKLPPNPLYDLIYNLMRLYEHKSKTGVSLYSVVRYAFSHLKLRLLVDRVNEK
jgi:radical SAM superfamily enzyme YgiQ (UPF0313 family)